MTKNERCRTRVLPRASGVVARSLRRLPPAHRACPPFSIPSACCPCRFPRIISPLPITCHRAAPGHWQVNDVVDEAGHHYVNLVMEGGGVLACPTFGLKLEQSCTMRNRTEKFTQLLGNIFGTTPHGHDCSLIAREPDFRLMVSYAGTTCFNWRDFKLNGSTRQALFARARGAVSK